MIEFDEVRLVDVSRHFGRRRAVSQISLTARSGDILGLLGPNGAGKSTLIGMLATLVAPTSGSVTFGGQPARALGGPLRKTIGLLAHELHLYTELSARQNLTFFAQLYGIGGSDAVERAIGRLGLDVTSTGDVLSTMSLPDDGALATALPPSSSSARVLTAGAPYRRSDGTYRFENRMRYWVVSA